MSKLLRIFLILQLWLMPGCCVIAQYPNCKDYLQAREELVSKIEESTYNDFNTLYSLCHNLITLARENHDIKYELYGIYNICWNATGEQMLDTLKAYMSYGRKLLDENKERLDTVDTDGIYRASMINALGSYFFTLGNYRTSIELFSNIINPGAKPLTSDSDLIHSSANYLGQSYYNLGSYDKSMQYFDFGRRYIKNDDYKEYNKALYYSYYCENFSAMEKNNDAIDYLNNAIKILNDNPHFDRTGHLRAADYILMAEYLQKKKQYDSAKYYLIKALSTYKNIKKKAYAYQDMAELFYEIGMPDSSLNYFQKSLQINEDIFTEDHYSKSACLTGIANIYRDRGNLAKAHEYYQISLKALLMGDLSKKSDYLSVRNISHPEQAMDIILQQAQLYYNWYLKDSLQSYLDTCNYLILQGLSLNDLSRRQLLNIRTKEAKSAVRSQLTSLGVDAASKAYRINKEKKYLEMAFDFMEDSKGSILIDKINDEAARIFSGIPGTVITEEITLRNELGEINNLLSSSKDSVKLQEYEAAYYEKFREYDRFITNLEQKYPRFYQLKYSHGSISLKEIQRMLPAGTLMIQYSIGDDRIFAGGVTNKTMIIKVAEKNEEFNRTLKVLLNQLGDPDISEKSQDVKVFAEFLKASSYLYGKLMAPVLKEAGSSIRQLIIVPENELCYLPFEILLTGEYSGKMDYRRLPYLFKKYNVYYEYSATLWKESSIQKFRNGNPYVAFAPDENENLQSLIANDEEILKCCKLWRGACFTGKYATESSFKNASLLGSILQLATHTRLDDLEPQNSYFEFATDAGNSDDGFLHTYELYNMNIPAKLAILSSCETGKGRIKKGEGIISLARAFKYAGCHNIVMSLWKVNDKSTCEIMIRFNKYLKRGMRKDVALKKAREYYLKHSENVHPAYWGSFVLIGNDDPVRSVTILYLIVPVLIVIMVLFTFRMVFRRQS